MYISDNEKWVPVDRHRSGGKPEGRGGMEHGKVRRWSQSGAAERSRRVGMNRNDEETRWP